MERLPLVGVAIRFEGKVYSLPKPNRHHHVISLIVNKTGILSIDVESDDEGFIDEQGNFLNRKKALINAIEHNQLIDEVPLHYVLTSENLW
jgi:hypothetical protein